MPRRTPYWTLPAFALLVALPLGWAVAALAAIAGAQAAFRVARSAARRRARLQAIRAAGPGVTLGLDPHGDPVHLGDDQLAAHGLIVGASGAGKSTTMLGILTDRIARGMPVVAIDLKGSPTFARALEQAATASGRTIRIWSLDGPCHWNPLAHGNATELKDKLVATERFTEPHYQRAAERYVQTALQVLIAAGRQPQLDEVVALMEPKRLAALTRGLQRPLCERVLDYLSSLSPDQLSAVRGLGTRLAILTESDAGAYLGPGAETLDLRAALDGGEVVLFSLNSSVYGKLAAQLGTLVVQDVVSATGHRQRAGAEPPLATLAVDEFSALGTDHLLALLARGREPGVSLLLATQELADLERVARGFREQVLGLTGVKIVHRQDVPASAQLIAQIAGTERVWEISRQLRSPFASSAGATRGTAREVERYIVHPNEIKRLTTGQAIVLTKVPEARVERVGIIPFSRRGIGRSGGGTGRSGGGTGRSGGGIDRSGGGIDRSD